MTLVKRNLKNDPANDMTHAMLKAGQAREAIDYLDHLIRVNPLPDYFWLRGRAKHQLGNKCTVKDARELYASAIEDFKCAAHTDPKMLLGTPESQCPQREWVLPAYRQLLRSSDLKAVLFALRQIASFGSKACHLVSDVEQASSLPNAPPQVLIDIALKSIQRDDNNDDATNNLIPLEALANVEGQLSSLTPTGPGGQGECVDYSFELYEDARLPTSELVRRLSDKNEGRRARAVILLGINPNCNIGILPQIMAMLSDGQRVVRTMALLALGQLGSRLNDMPAQVRFEEMTTAILLKALLNDRSFAVRVAAAEAIERMFKSFDAEWKPEYALQSLVSTASDRDARVRAASIRAIGQIGAWAEKRQLLTSAIIDDTLLAALDDQDAEVRRASIAAWGRRRIVTDLILQRLSDVAVPDEWEPQLDKAEAILCVTTRPTDLIEHYRSTLTEIIRSAPFSSVRMKAIEALMRTKLDGETKLHLLVEREHMDDSSRVAELAKRYQRSLRR